MYTVSDSNTANVALIPRISPVATGGFWGFSPQKLNSKPPKLKQETL